MFEYILNKKGVVFDLDGTIADTQEVWDAAVDTTARTLLNIDYLDPSKYGRGYSMEDKWNMFIRDYSIRTDFKISELVSRTYSALADILRDPNFDYELGVKPGFWLLLHELKVDRNFKVAIATNADKAGAMELMKFLDLDGVFDFEIFGDDVRNRKPNPEIYNKAANLMGLPPKEIIVFEDSMVGIEAADKAYMECVVIRGREDTYDVDSYPSNCVDFMYDFSAFPGNIGKEYRDFVVSEEDQGKLDDLLKELNDQVASGKK